MPAIVSAAILLLALASLPAFAGRFNKVLDVGDAAPDWSGIVGTDDKPHALSDFAEAKAMVLVFTCNHCPVANACEERIIALQRDYQTRGVQVVAINVNNDEADTLEPMKVRAQESQFNFPYLYDPTQKIARDYGASVTPQVFVLDSARKIAYMGALDDNPLDSQAVTKPFVRSALDAILSGQAPSQTETKAKGCGILYD